MSSGEIVIQHEARGAAIERMPVGEIERQQSAIWELMAKVMKLGEDYGIIPGCKEKSLWKSGSEKILAMFRLAVDPIVEELASPGTDPYGEYRVRVHLTIKQMGSGVFVGKGIGECSSWEEKYKWRRAVNDAEFDYMDKKGLARIKFGNNWDTSKDYEVKQVRVPTADIANTIVKMGKKRSQIDGTLTTTAASSIFTQDLEDMPQELAEQLTAERAQAQSGEPVQQPTRKSAAKPQGASQGQQEASGDTITIGQSKMVYAISKKAKLSDDEIKEKLRVEFGVNRTEELKKSDMDKYLDSIDPNKEFRTK